MGKGHVRAVAVGVTAFATAILTNIADGDITILEVIGAICTTAVATAAVYLTPPDTAE
jgi:hypothetical protein